MSGKVSIHAPLAGCDVVAACVLFTIDVSIHAPLAGCDGMPRDCSGDPHCFNPRTPRGVRPQDSHRLLCLLCFNPRTPRGVRLEADAVKRFSRSFNPRTPRGVRPSA